MSTPPRSAYHHGDLRAALLARATDAIDRDGAAGFSLRAACKTLGVDPAAAYRHFPNREAVLAAVADHAFDRMGATMQEELARSRSRGAEARLVAVGLGYVGFALAHPRLFELAFANPRRPGLQPGVVRPTAYDLLADSLRALAVEARIPAVGLDHAALVAWSAVHGYATLRLRDVLPPRAGRRWRTEVRRLCRTVVAGLAADPRPGR